ncbi:hypothetical protein D3C83_167290 [compost metagenome]
MPHHLPGDKHFLMEFAQQHNLPYEATRGGAHTALPEYARQIATQTPAATRSSR